MNLEERQGQTCDIWERLDDFWGKTRPVWERASHPYHETKRLRHNQRKHALWVTVAGSEDISPTRQIQLMKIRRQKRLHHAAEAESPRISPPGESSHHANANSNAIHP